MEGEPVRLEVEDALDELVLMAMDGAVANRCRSQPERAVKARRARSAAPWRRGQQKTGTLICPGRRYHAERYYRANTPHTQGWVAFHYIA